MYKFVRALNVGPGLGLNVLGRRENIIVQNRVYKPLGFVKVCGPMFCGLAYQASWLIYQFLETKGQVAYPLFNYEL